MSEIASQEIPVSVDAAAAAWLRRLDSGPDEAVEALLLGRVWLGGYASFDPPEALPQFIPMGLLPTLDNALQRWLSTQLQRYGLPAAVIAEQYAQALCSAFGILQTVDLPLAQAWCRDQATRLWGWLAVQPNDDANNPRLAFLRALALRQPNRDLLQFWAGLCRGSQRSYSRAEVQLALFGLRRMPADDEGRSSDGLPSALVGGLIDYGIRLSHRAEECKAEWLAELDFLSAVYPMSSKVWQARLRGALDTRVPATVEVLRSWVDARFPTNNSSVRSSARSTGPVVPHFKNEVEPLLKQFDRQQALVRPPLQALADRHRHYANETGDSHFLVPSFCRLAEFLLESPAGSADASRDPAWALDFAQHATHWAPGNPRTWSVMARVLDAMGDWPRACATFWYARRRFPYNTFSHNQLGHALAMRGFVDEGEAVYRAAIQRFPDDPVSWTDLGKTLRMAGKLEWALSVYQQAQQRFNSDPVIGVGMATALIDLDRTEEARSALQWAERVTLEDDVRTLRAIEALRRRLGRPSGSGVTMPRALPSGLAHSSGDWATLEHLAGASLLGIDSLAEATLWRQNSQGGGMVEASAALERAQAIMGLDSRWVSENGLCLAAKDGWPVARDYFESMSTQRPGDGVLAALRLHARERSGESADWQSLRGRFEELAPIVRAAQHPLAGRDRELALAVASATEDGNVNWNNLDDDTRQALWVLDRSASPELSELTREDFLAARQLSVL